MHLFGCGSEQTVAYETESVQHGSSLFCSLMTDGGCEESGRILNDSDVQPAALKSAFTRCWSRQKVELSIIALN